MTCAPFITQPATVLGGGDTVAAAVESLAANNFKPLPVVDGDRRLVGVFGPSDLATLLLPMGARLAGDSFDIGFVSEPLAQLRERLAAAGPARLGDHAGAHEPVRLATSVDEVLLRMHRGETFLVAVDDDGRLAGVITAATVLAQVVEGR